MLGFSHWEFGIKCWNGAFNEKYITKINYLIMKKILFIGLSIAAMISCSRAKETIEYGDYQDNTPENPTKMAKVIYGEDIL